MTNREVGEVPNLTERPERLQRALGRSEEIADHTDQDERERVADADGPGTPLHGEQEVPGAGDHRNEHPHAEHDRDRLQQPRRGAVDEVMGADHGVEHHLGPEGQHTEGVGVDRLVKQLGEEVVGEAKHHGCEPHADALMHVVALDDRVGEPVLYKRDVRDGHQYQSPQQRCEDVPVGDVDLLGPPVRDGLVQVIGQQGQPGGEQSHCRPDELTELSRPVGHAREQQQHASENRAIDEPQTDSGQSDAVDGSLRSPGHHPQCQPEHRQRGPAPEYHVGMHRPQAAEAEPRSDTQVRVRELESEVLAYEGPEDKPDRRAHEVRRDRRVNSGSISITSTTRLLVTASGRSTTGSSSSGFFGRPEAVRRAWREQGQPRIGCG